MNIKMKNALIVVLCLVILGSIMLSAYTVAIRSSKDEPNPNVTLVTAPEQDGFEVHPEWTVPPVEEIDYGENIALGKEVYQNGHTQIYHSRNTVDGDRFTYWEGMADSYPNVITIDMGEATEMTGTQILLNPKAIWGARTQAVEIQISDDNENYITIMESTLLSFDSMTGNCAYVPFSETVTAQYIRFLFRSNSGANAGQAAEIEVYAPKE